MALFGKKKLSIDELVKGIQELSEDEKNKLMSMLTKTEAPVEEVVEETEAMETPVEEEQEAPMASEEVEEVEQEETVEEPTEEETTEEPLTEAPMEEDTMEEIVEEEVVDNSPTDTPAPVEEPAASQNYDEIIASQNARIDSLESVIKALKETVDKVVANQDNKNFGVSPKANFDEDLTVSRRNAILQGYAPRRADQYK